MKVIYYYDNDYKSNGENDIIFPYENGQYNIPNNATDIAPEQGLYQPLHFNIDKQKWEGVSKEDWKKDHPNEEGLIETPKTNVDFTSDKELRQTFGSLQMSSVKTVKIVMDLSRQVTELTKQNVKLQKELNDKGE